LTGWVPVDSKDGMKSRLKAQLLFFVFLFSIAPSAFAESGPVSLNLDVPAGQWKAARLKNLPKGAMVAVQIVSNGPILVGLLDSTSQGQPDTSRPLFAGQVEARLSFSVTVSEAGDHFLVLDNRRGAAARAVSVHLNAARSAADRLDAANQMFRAFELQLARIFVFEPFPIAIKACGTPRAFADTGGILLCTEYMQQLLSILGNGEKTMDVLSFSLFHEIARLLLTSWKNPFAANLEAVDELAAALLVMLNQKARAEGAAQFMVKNPAAAESLKKLFPDGPHPLSTQRAKAVLTWIRDPQLALKWQPVLVPHMQTELLKKLKSQPTSWTDLSLVKKELALREKKAI
jgi:hypothetical protein